MLVTRLIYHKLNFKVTPKNNNKKIKKLKYHLFLPLAVGVSHLQRFHIIIFAAPISNTPTRYFRNIIVIPEPISEESSSWSETAEKKKVNPTAATIAAIIFSP